MTAGNESSDGMIPKSRAYRVDVKRCVVSTCDGELAEMRRIEYRIQNTGDKGIFEF